MQILVSESSVLIEFLKRNLLAKMFELSFQFAVPDLLFNEELIDLGRYHRQDLIRMGLRVEAPDPEGVATAIAYQSRRPGSGPSPRVHPSDRGKANEILRLGGFELGRQCFTAGPWTRQIRLINSEQLPVSAFC